MHAVNSQGTQDDMHGQSHYVYEIRTESMKLSLEWSLPVRWNATRDLKCLIHLRIEFVRDRTRGSRRVRRDPVFPFVRVRVAKAETQCIGEEESDAISQEVDGHGTETNLVSCTVFAEVLRDSRDVHRRELSREGFPRLHGGNKRCCRSPSNR